MNRLIVAGIAALMVATPVFASNLLVNGSFENGMAGWTQATYWWAGWGWGPPTVNSITGMGTFGSFSMPKHGSRFAGYDHAGHGNFHVGAYQTFPTVPGVTYTVSGWAGGGCQAANDTAWWEVKVSPGTTSDPDAPGTVIFKRERPAGAGYFEFQATYFSNTFVASSTTATIFLKAGRAQSADWAISGAAWDDLVVVPEPITALLLTLALPCLRRRRA